MKKILFVLISLLAFSGIVNASTETYERKPEENYGSKKYEIDTENKRQHVIRTPYVDASEKIYDFANKLTDQEEKKLYNKIVKFINQYDTELVIVTINMAYSSDTENEDYAADFYDYNDFGIDFKKYDGILLLHNCYPENNYYNIYTFGNAQLYFSEEKYDASLDEIYPDLKSAKYFTGYDKFIDRMEYFYKNGKDKELEDYTVDKNGVLYKKIYKIPFLLLLLFLLY